MRSSRRRIFFEALLVFFLSAAFFSFLERHGTFPDPDSFYHAKMGSLILRDGALHQFPWLPFTILHDRFVDHHFLYHLALVPFIGIAGPLWGTTIATIIFAATVFAIFYFLLRACAVRYAPFFTLLLALASPFVFRMGIAKASALSVLFLLLLLYALWRRRLLAIVVIAFFYVWLFDGWPIALVAAFATTLGEIIANRIAGKQYVKQMLLPLLLVSLGILCGIIVNPYFPENLSFFWSHIVRIGALHSFSALPLGGEWDAVSPLQIFGAIAPASITLLFVTLSFFFARRPPAHAPPHDTAAHCMPALWSMGILSVLFFVATLTAERHSEYFIPSMIFFTALLYTFVSADDPQLIRRTFAGILPAWGMMRRIALGALFILLFVAIVRDFFLLEKNFRDGFPWTTYRGVADFLQNNTPNNALVVNARWDDFPMLFFWNDRNRYAAGLDPTFLYLFDRNAYDRFAGIMGGSGNIADTIERFGAKMIFVRTSDTDLMNRLTVAGFREQYHDNEGSLYAQ